MQQKLLQNRLGATFRTTCNAYGPRLCDAYFMRVSNRPAAPCSAARLRL